MALARFFKRKFLEFDTALIISASVKPSSSFRSPMLMFLAGKNTPARFILFTSINSFIRWLFIICSSVMESSSITSVNAEPIKPAGTAKMAMPRTPITHAMSRPINVMGGVSAKAPGSPIYCANDHTTDFQPLSYTSGWALCSTKNSINDKINVTIARNCNETTISSLLAFIALERILNAFT